MTDAGKQKARWRLVAINLAVLVLVLMGLEGLASYTLVVRDITKTHSLAERRHTRYDSHLGWVNESGVFIPDMYGPHVYLKTNSQGFRSSRDFANAVPPGKSRIICSGDSFTLGYGVDNDHTWCQRLVNIDPRLETVNMGQGGYGVDQAYLWYQRDGGKLEHQVHVFAFVAVDFYRMQVSRFSGYDKPVLNIENGRLVVRNVPVPEPAGGQGRLSAITENLKSLRIVELINRAAWRLRSTPEAPGWLSEGNRDGETREVVRKVLQDLARINEERSSKLVLVYLPMLQELRGADIGGWRAFAETESRALGIRFIDLSKPFRTLSHEDALAMYIPEGQLAYPGAAGHLNNWGNEFVASMLYTELRNDPSFAKKLGIY